MIRQYLRLASKGIMGMNRRNISYVSRYNDRSLFPLVDDKRKTKELAIEHEVTVPGLIAVVDSQHAARNIEKLVADHRSFCIKPAKGSGGKGILVVAYSENGAYYKTNGNVIDALELQRHVSNILAGLFSLGGASDVAMVESCIVVDEYLASYSYEGVPDIRVIVFKGVPIMAMMRLSCADSNGKANLHQGAIGVGLDICTGKAVNAVKNDRPITTHPDTGQDLQQLQLPHWDDLLMLASSCADMSGLGYLGVDLVIDQKHGPMLLELNARPGLSIQMANNKGLLPRLKEIERRPKIERCSVAERVQIAQSLFSDI